MYAHLKSSGFSHAIRYRDFDNAVLRISARCENLPRNLPFEALNTLSAEIAAPSVSDRPFSLVWGNEVFDPLARGLPRVHETLEVLEGTLGYHGTWFGLRLGLRNKDIES